MERLVREVSEAREHALWGLEGAAPCGRRFYRANGEISQPVWGSCISGSLKGGPYDHTGRPVEAPHEGRRPLSARML